MKFAASYFIAMALLMAANMRAQDAASITDKPYVGIVERNMFGLLPIPPPDTNSSAAPVDPPPKITPTGIMTIFGREQALFKAANKPKPGQPQAKEDAYVLAEGERQDDIEVVKINRLDGIITFNNHGTIQELPLIPAKDAGAGGPGGGGQGNPMRPGSMPGAERGGISRTRSTERSGMNTSGNAGNLNNSSSSTASLNDNSGITTSGGTTVNSRGIYQPVDTGEITPEQSVLLIEAQRMQYLQAGDEKQANMLPTTPITTQVLKESK